MQGKGGQGQVEDRPCQGHPRQEPAAGQEGAASCGRQGAHGDAPGGAGKCGAAPVGSWTRARGRSRKELELEQRGQGTVKAHSREELEAPTADATGHGFEELAPPTDTEAMGRGEHKLQQLVYHAQGEVKG